MTIRRQVKPKSATATVETLETKAKRLVQDLTLLKHEIREAERCGGSKRDLDLINSRVYMLQQSSWAMRDMLSDFADEMRDAMNTPEPVPQLRLTGER